MSAPTAAPPRLSVIVPTIGRPEELRGLIASIRAQTVLPQELVVVDAGPLQHGVEQACAEALEGSGIALKYARSAPGTSLQRNVALEHAEGELYFLFDDDLTIEPDYIERTLEVFALPTEPPVGCVLGTFSSPPRAGGRARKAWFRAFGLTHARAGDEARMYMSGGVQWAQRPSRVIRVPAASGGRTAYRAACFAEERFAEYLPGRTQNEDVELSYRIGRHWTILQSPDVVCFHDRVEKGRTAYGDRVARVVYANYWFFKQHRPKDPAHLAAFAWANLGLSTYYAAVGVAKRQPRDLVGGLVKGYRWCAEDLRGKTISAFSPPA